MSGTEGTGDRTHGAELRTFLIADIRGYTSYTREHGDEAAAELAGTFAAEVRGTVEKREGVLLELRGDEALVVFASARQAVRAAVDLQERFRQEAFLRGVGIGLDAGEAVAVEGGFRGGPLNLAARLCGQAEPGEILASEAVIHMAAKVDGVAYVNPRTLRLKGYDAPVRAVEVVASDRVRKGMRLRLHRARRRLRKDRRLRLTITTGVVIAVIIAVLAVVLPGLGGSGSALLKLPAGMALLDAKTGTLRKFIPKSSVDEPVGAVFADGHFWVENVSPLSIVEVDPMTGQIDRQFNSPLEDLEGFTVDGNSLWAVGGGPDVAKMDIPSGTVQKWDLSKDPGVDADGGSGGVAMGAGSLWVTRPFGLGQTLRLDPSTLKLQKLFPGYSGSIAYDKGAIWTVNGSGASRIDPQANVRFPIDLLGGTGVAAGGGFGWTADPTKGVVYRMDQAGRITDYPTGLGAYVGSYSDGVLWVANEDEGTVTGIDANTGSTTATYRFAHQLLGVAAGGGAVLAFLQSGPSVEQRIAALTGKVAKLFISNQNTGFNADPALTFTGSMPEQIAFATCAMLLNYPDKPPPEGWQLEPEVAAAMPAVSPDRRTYTFTVRPGYQFSPPSNERVTAETFRYSIERALSPGMASGNAQGMIGDILGEQAFIDGKADHISGLKATGDQLSVTLVKPSADFLERLAAPYFCPVPTGTPLTGEANFRPTAGDPESGTVPSTGPYYIANMSDGYIILKPNPHYGGHRPHTFDAIVLRDGVAGSVALQRVRQEGWDGISNVYDPELDPTGTLASRWGPGSPAAAKGDQRYYASDDHGLWFLEFNAGRPLFADRDVREAVSLVIDRQALLRTLPVDLASGVPWDGVLPPSLPGAPQQPRAVPAADLARARALMRGRTGKAVMAIYSRPSAVRLAQVLKAELAQIGIDLVAEQVDCAICAIHEPGAPYDIRSASSNDAEVLDTARFLRESFWSHPGDWPTGDMPREWLPEDVRRAAGQLEQPSGPAQDTAVRSFLSLLQREAAIAPFAYPVFGEYLSPRIGCRVFPPLRGGVDLAAMCLKASS